MRYIVVLGLLSILPLWLTAQGCSDAGVCTAGPIGDPAQQVDTLVTGPEYLHSTRMTFSYAIGERGVTIVQLVPQVDIMVTRKLGIQLKMPYIASSGDLGSNSGIGDPVITSTYNFIRTKTRRLDALFGLKLPVNDANAAEGYLPLPMPYQTSLGTTDLLLGLSYRVRRWQFALAYQHVLDQGNRNEFTHSIWMDDMRALGYFKSFHLQRAPDAVARIQYGVPLRRLQLRPGLLAIMHVDDDLRRDRFLAESRIMIEGSQGLTLNLTLDAQYRISDQWALLLAYGSPVITRDTRPDGLTRFLVLNMGVMHRFGSD